MASWISDMGHISLQAGEILGRHFAEVFLQEQPHLVIVQAVVVAEIPQVEEDIAHAGVFPIQQADLADLAGHILVHPVQVEQVVVAGGGDIGILEQRLFDLAHLLHDPVEIEWEFAVVALGDFGEHFHPAEDVEFALQFRRLRVEQAELAHHPDDIIRLCDHLGWDVFAVDKAGQQVAFRLDEVYHFWSNAQPASRLVCLRVRHHA